MPKVSILLPVYNSEKYLKRCLDALLRQTYREIEVVAVNDGSTDSSLAILEDYASRDSRIKVFSHENKGPATTRNVALDNAIGEYLMFCDSDDWYEDNMVERMVATIENKNADVVMCQANRVLEDGCKRDMSLIPEKYINSNINPNKKNEKSILNNPYLWNKIFRKSIIDRYNIRFPDGHEHDDLAFCFMLKYVISKWFYLREKLYNYVYRDDSVMHRYLSGHPRNRRDHLEVCYFIFKNLERLGLLERCKKDVVHFFKNHVKCMSYLVSPSERNAIVNEVNEFFVNKHIRARLVVIEEKIYLLSKWNFIKYSARFIGKALSINFSKGEKREMCQKKAQIYKTLVSEGFKFFKD